MSKEYDLVVLGGGTGGYVAAIRAAQLGMSVALVEKDKIGGTCLHDGCIPSKTLLKTAELHRQLINANEFGLEISSFQLNLEQTQKRKNNIIANLYQGVDALLKKGQIDVYKGTGRILGPSIFSPMPGTISVEHDNGEENTMLTPKFVLIATGSSPRGIEGVSVDGTHVLYSHHALQLTKLPSSMIIVGGGVIGIEWASMLQDLGVNVTVVEGGETILANEDKEVQQAVQQQLEERGVTFFVNTTITPSSVIVENNQVSVEVVSEDKSRMVQTEKMLLSVGRNPNIDNIGLSNTNIIEKNGAIVTNDMYQTKDTHIYAIGDCIGGMQLAHVASAEGIVAVEHMTGNNPTAINTLHIPSCIYSYPEVGRVGMTEEEAIKEGYQIKIGTFPFQGVGKAHIEGNPIGFSKIITDDQTKDILGVHIVGEKATDLISEAGLAKVLDATAWEISKTIHPHPSLSEAIYESALAVDDLQIHG